jgi:hypothetical protein
VIVPVVDVDVVTAAIQDVLNAALSHLLQSELQAIVPPSGPQNQSCATLQLELAWFQLSAGGFYGQLHSCSDLPICGFSSDPNCYTAPMPVTVSGERGKGKTLGNIFCTVARENGPNAGSTLADILATVQARLGP